MKKFTLTATLVALAFATTACSKKDMSPGEVATAFLKDFATEDVDGASALAAPAMKMRMLANPNVTKAASAESKASVDKCGGYKEITPSYNPKADATMVEGFSLLQYNGQCPAMQQWIRLRKNEGHWLVDEFGPLTKP